MPARPRLATLAPALAAAALAVAALTAGAGSAATGPPLADPQLGVPVSAPPPPTVGGAPAQSVERRWLRCRRYRVLVDADRPAGLWHLADVDAIARDAAGAADGRYARAVHGGIAGALVGQGDRAASFNGAQDAVTVPGASDVSGRRPYTFELWARPDTVDGSFRYLVSREATGAGARQGTNVWLSRAGLGFERWSNGVKAGVTYASALPAGRWSAISASYDGSTMRLYLNGRQVGSRATTAPLAAGGTLTLGAGAGGGSGHFDGALDEVALYTRALTRSHIAAHVAAGAAGPCSTITGATATTYTPVSADLGDTLRVITTATRTSAPAGKVTSISESAGVVDDHGQLVRPAITAPTAGATLSGTVQVGASVAGLPLDRIEFVVDGVVRYAKQEAPYRYTWYTAAEANGRHTVSVRVYGPRSTVPVTAQATVTVSNRTVYPPPLPFGRESMYAEFNEGDAAVANNLLDNVWPARGFPLPNLGWPLTWREDPYNDAYWRFYFYSLRPESSLLYLWQTTGNVRYRDRLIAILRSFAAHDAIRPVNTLTFDNNHAAAYRTMTLINFFFKLERAGALPPDLKQSLTASLARLGSFLAAPEHFEGEVNHGFNEGAALLLLAKNFPDLPGAASWRQTAIERLEGMLDDTLDADGVLVENSPFYHVYVLGLVYQIAQWAQRWEPALAPPYSEAARRMLRHAAYVTQPSGYLPMLGATATTYLPSQDPTVYGPMADADPEFAFAYTRGARGTPPPNGTYLFPSSGLFLMRSPLTSPSALAQQTFVTFDAGPYRTEHSDLDALGITVYSNGSTVLPESGLFTYTVQPDRSYFHGTRAHNTVVVDGRDQAAGSATAGPRGGAGGATWASASSALYAGVTHRRSVVVLRQGLVLVLDRLTSATSHAYTQTWHLPPATTVGVSGRDVAVRNGAGQRVLAVRQANPTGLSLATIKGRTSPTMQGWYSSSYGSKVPAYALEYTRSSAGATFATLLAAGPYAAQTGTVARRAVSGGDRVDVCVGTGVAYAVTVPSSGGPVAIGSGSCPAPGS